LFVRKLCCIVCLCLPTVGTVKAHEFRAHAKPPPTVGDLIDPSDFDQLVMNSPDDGTRWVLSRTLLWKPGSTLNACFLNGSDSSRSTVMNDARYIVEAPSHPINLKIGFSDGAGTNCKAVSGAYKEDLRISFTDGCCSAYVGRTSHNSAVEKAANVFLQEGLDDVTIKHELLHALGFQHEHQRPDSPCNFNYSVIEAAYGWSEAEVINNFKRLDKNSSRLATSPGFDKDSIMKYYFEESFLKEGTGSPCYEPRATDLSLGDWQGLQTAYPMNFDVAQFKATVQSKRASINLGANPSPALTEALASLPLD